MTKAKNNNYLIKVFTFFKKNPVYLLLVAFLVFLIIFQLPFFNSSEQIAGWDTVAHEYTIEKYSENLYKGNFFFWDSSWFNGYPSLLFYPPLFFIIVNILHYLTFGLIGISLLLKLIFLLSSLLFVYAVYYLLSNFFNFSENKNIIYTTLVSFLWLLAPSMFDQFGIGLASLYSLGEFTNFISIIIGLFLIGYCKIFLNTKKKKLKNYLYFIFLYSTLLLTHVFSFFFFSILLFFMLIEYIIRNYKQKLIFKRTIKPVIIVIISTIVVSSFWLLPFLINLSYSTAQPYTVFFSNLNFNQFYLFFLVFGSKLRYLFFILSSIGLIYCIIKRKHLSLILGYVVAVLLTYSITFGLNLTLHYYRFAAYMYLIYIIFIILGLEFINKLNFKKIYEYLLVICFIFLIYFLISGQNGFSVYYKHNVDNYPYYETSENLIQDLKELDKIQPITNVYAEQLRMEYLDCLSSPHIIESDLAKNDIPSIFGLYTESTTMSRYIYFLVYGISDNASWIVPKSLKERRVKIESVYDRLSYFNINYIIAYSNKLKTNLDNYSNSYLIKTYDLGCQNKFNLYKFNSPNSNEKEVIVSNHKPFIYFSNKEDTTLFARIWFEKSELYKFPLIKSKQKINKFDFSNFNDRFSGIILQENKTISSSLEQIIKDNNIKVILSKYDINKSDVELFYNNENITDLTNIISNVDSNSNITNINIIDSKINFTINSNKEVPIIIRKSYFPYWKSNNLEIYDVTPNQMLVFSENDDIDLTFKIPVIFKVLFVVFILFFIFMILVIFNLITLNK